MRHEHGGFERHLNHLGLAVGIGREVEDARAWGTHGEVYLAVAGDAGHVEALDVARAVLAVAVHHVIDGSLVAFLEHAKPQHVLTHEKFLGHTHHFELSVTIEDDDVVDVGAVAHKFVLLQARTDESLLAVNVELLVGLGHLRGFDGVEVLNLSEARMILAILVLEELEPRGSHLGQVRQVAVYLLNLGLDAGHQLVGLLLVELQDALHLYLQQAQNVVLRHLAHQLRVVGSEAVVNMFADLVHVGGLLKLAILVDALLNEYLFQRLEVQLLQQLVLADFQLLPDEVFRALSAVDEHVAHGEELRLLVGNDAAIGRDVDFAVGEGIEGVDGLVA